MNNITPSILNVKSCASLEAEVLKDLESTEPSKTIAEILDEKTEVKEKDKTIEKTQ
jgi:hypothetical protein